MLTMSQAVLPPVFLVALVAPSLRAQDAADDGGAARVIVRFRADSSLARSNGLSPQGAVAARAEALGARLGLALSAGAAVSGLAQVVFASGVTSAELAERLALESDVAYAVPDERRRIVGAPNDPLYAAGVTGSSPEAGQWYLRAPSGEVASSSNVEGAWAVTTGSPDIVVAVVDTGVRYEHPDLLSVAAGGHLLPGYDMVSDPASANDGDGRDADASDPGDWLTRAELSRPGSSLFRCATSPSSSSWHGTQLSGLVAALTDNGIGMAGAAPGARVLPVRVLGKCGGYDSDIVAGMRWAAGLGVPGAPANPHPARVINLSLGGDGACSAAYQEAVDEITAAGTVIVAAVGNSSGHAVASPANCRGVIAVAGLRHAGTKVGFSSLGPEVAISAPGGNCVNTAPGSAVPVPRPDDNRLGRDRASRLHLHRQLQHFRRDELLGAPRGRRRRARPVGALRDDAAGGHAAAAGHGAAVPGARERPLERQRAGVHDAAVQPHGHAGRPAGVLLHHRDVWGGHARCRCGPGRNRVGRTRTRTPPARPDHRKGAVRTVRRVSGDVAFVESSGNERLLDRLDPGVLADVVDDEVAVELPVRPAPAEPLRRRARRRPCTARASPCRPCRRPRTRRAAAGGRAPPPTAAPSRSRARSAAAPGRCRSTRRPSLSLFSASTARPGG